VGGRDVGDRGLVREGLNDTGFLLGRPFRAGLGFGGIDGTGQFAVGSLQLAVGRGEPVGSWQLAGKSEGRRALQRIGMC
jgi:hypothetical protein